MTDMTEPMDVSMNALSSPQEILEEINYRLSSYSKNTIIVKRLPKRVSVNDLVEELQDVLSVRIGSKKNSNFVFLQFKDENATQKYLTFFNNKVIAGKKIIATLAKPHEPYTSLESFNLKKLYMKGLRPETNYGYMKKIYPNAEVFMPRKKDASNKGLLILTFKTEDEAKTAFLENKIKLNRVNVQLNYYPKPEKEIALDYNNSVELLKEINLRFEKMKESVIVTNLPKTIKNEELIQYLPEFISCQLNSKKGNALVRYDSVENAQNAVNKLRNVKIDNKSIRAFVNKKQILVESLDQLDLTTLHISNLKFDTKMDDIEKIFDSNAIDFPVNEDGSSVGYCTVSFENQDESLKYFNKATLQIKNHTINVNFQLKEILKAAGKKRNRQNSLNTSESEDVCNDNSAKKQMTDTKKVQKNNKRKREESLDKSAAESTAVEEQSSLIKKAKHCTNDNGVDDNESGTTTTELTEKSDVKLAEQKENCETANVNNKNSNKRNKKKRNKKNKKQNE